MRWYPIVIVCWRHAKAGSKGPGLVHGPYTILSSRLHHLILFLIFLPPCLSSSLRHLGPCLQRVTSFPLQPTMAQESRNMKIDSVIENKERSVLSLDLTLIPLSLLLSFLSFLWSPRDRHESDQQNASSWC